MEFFLIVVVELIVVVLVCYDLFFFMQNFDGQIVVLVQVVDVFERVIVFLELIVDLVIQGILFFVINLFLFFGRGLENI